MTASVERCATEPESSSETVSESDRISISEEFQCEKTENIETNSNAESRESTVLIKTDKGYYDPNEVLTDIQKIFLVANKPCRPLGPFPKDDKGKSFSAFYYTKTCMSGIKTERLWLCYSKILDKCYCLPCWLFGQANDAIASGYNDWRHLQQAISRHEQKVNHSVSCAIFDRWRLNKTIDVDLESKIRQEMNVWRQVLERVIEVTLTLASCNMPFRGHDETENSKNPGVFLSVIKLLSKYDPVLQNLLENKKKHSITYLSSTVQTEVIEMLGNTIKQNIIKKIKCSPFFSVILDTTQDIAKTDQLSIIIRYVSTNNTGDNPLQIKIHESFLGFVPVKSQTGSALSATILDILMENELPVEKLRGQGYDGAANMSGIYNGVQAEILKVSPNAYYVHCAAHNLNLVLNDSVKNVVEIRNFYDLVESVYVFFGHSIKRWALLQSITNAKITIKKLTPTRWSSRHDALEALRFRYVDILKTLAKIMLTSTNKAEVNEAKSLRNHLEKFETVFLVVFQNKILKNIDALSKLLQKKEQNIEAASKMFTTATEIINQMRNNFDVIKTDAVILARQWGTTPQFENKRISRPKIIFDDVNNHYQVQTSDDWFRINVFFKTIDIITAQLKNRSSGLYKICSYFRVLFPNVLRDPSISDKDIYDMSQALHLQYIEDIADTISSQVLSFRECFKKDLDNLTSIFDLLDFILVKNYYSSSSFSEIVTACIIFLTIPISVASAERSFSKLKLIKTYLRNCMTDKKLSALAIISIENEEAQKIDISNLISNFAHAKARKKDFTK